ncbi:MAG: histidine phosphatase family protein, partial [Chloroflexota bacterium]
RRAVQTATHVADYLDLPINLESGIVEWLNPKWYDYTTWRQPIAERLEEFPRINPKYKSLVEPQYPEHHESIPWARGTYVARYLAHSHDKPILLVSHGVIVLTLAEALAGVRKGVSDQTCAISHFEGSGYEWKMLSSSTAHLDKELEDESVDFV